MPTDSLATIIESKVICKQPGRYIGWPTIGRMPDGELLAVFSGDRDAHVDPFGKSFLVRSGDNGESWSNPERINDTPLDDRDTGICICRDGTVIMSWFTSHYQKETYMRWAGEGQGQRWSDRIDAVTVTELRQWAGEELENGRYNLGHWIRRSTDRGQTWEGPVRVPPTTPHGPIQLADGRIIFVGIETNHGRSENRGSILTAQSEDLGKTWSVIGRFSMFPKYQGEAEDGYGYFCEPHVVEVSPGKLLAMARYEEIPRDPECCFLWQAFSDDGGYSWTEPEQTPIFGKPPHLLRLSDGRILVTYGHRRPAFGQRACLSTDGGRTWDYENKIILRDDAPNGDLGYPATVELDDGTLLTVYYQQEHAGEKTCLMTTKWRLDG